MDRFQKIGRNERERALFVAVRSLPILAAVSFAACDNPPPAEPLDAAGGASGMIAASVTAASDDAAVALAWLRLSFDLTREEGLTPPVAARAYAYVGVTLWEAVAPGVPDGRSLAGQLNGLAALPAPGQALHWPTVANAALSAVMQKFYTSPASGRAIHDLELTFQDRFRGDVPGSLYGPSIAHGQRLAAAIGQWSRSDGYRQLGDCRYSPPSGPGMWSPTPPDFGPAVEPCWGQLRPFVLSGAGQCAPQVHPRYSEDPASAFYQEAIEVYETVNALTDDQRTIAFYWADLPGETGTPAGHSLSMAAQALERTHASLDLAAEAFARVGIGESDAFISCWATKYHYNLIRPVTYLNAVVDPYWEPLIETPPFPAYTSGHSNDAGASSTILTALFGDGFAFTDHTNDRYGFAPRSFGSFFEAADESAFSRLYGGIHYRADIERGLSQGACVGRAVNALLFRAAPLTAP